MSLSQEIVKVETVTQYGFRSGGKNYGLSPKLKEKGIEPSEFKVGTTYVCEIYTGPKGGKSVNAYSEVSPGTVVPSVATPTPSLPSTTVSTTVAPGGVAPIAPAKRVAEQAVVQAQSENDKMTKADWSNKDRMIGIDAVIKSSLESPALGQLVVGKNQEEAFQTARDFIRFNLETQRLAKEGSL